MDRRILPALITLLIVAYPVLLGRGTGAWSLAFGASLLALVGCLSGRFSLLAIAGGIALIQAGLWPAAGSLRAGIESCVTGIGIFLMLEIGHVTGRLPAKRMGRPRSREEKELQAALWTNWMKPLLLRTLLLAAISLLLFGGYIAARSRWDVPLPAGIVMVIGASLVVGLILYFTALDVNSHPNSHPEE